MGLFLGLDTSNYTTSAALYDTGSGVMTVKSLPLPVKEGQAGLRQSDAVFHHTRQLPIVMSELFGDLPRKAVITAAGVTSRPRNAEGSYMPCFLCGVGLAESLAAAEGFVVHKTSHQIGHIFAALYSADKLSLIDKPFIAFHVSGGTTDCLYCIPDPDEGIRAAEISSSLDLKAGQLIDRVGLMMGLKFPCGMEIEALAETSQLKFSSKAVMRDGYCSLSGFENQAQKMLMEGESRENTARFVLNAVYDTVYRMTLHARKVFGNIPVVYAGGVMSNRYIAGLLSDRLDNVYFSAPEFSRDNAAGAAVYASVCTKNAMMLIM